MPTLVTGGTGFVGIHIMRQLADSGEPVISMSTMGRLDDVSQQFLTGTAGSVTCLEADILNLDLLRYEIHRRGIDTVVHGAAITAIGDLEPQVARDAIMVNVGGTGTVLEASRLEGVKRFVHLSSASVYGSGDPRIPLKEDVVLQPAGIYAITKRSAEEIVLRYIDLFGMDAAIMRISAPYGPFERPTGLRTVMSPVYEWCRAALKREAIRVRDDLERDLTYVVDTARCIVLACKNEALAHRIYNVSSGTNIRFSAALETLVHLRHGFSFRIEPSMTGTDFFRTSLRGPLSMKRTREDLGFVPRYSIESGLKAYLDWLETHPL